MPIERDKIMRTAISLTERGRYDQALASYRTLYVDQPDDARVPLRVGELRAKTGAFGKAFEAYEHAGSILAEQGFVARAIAAYELALDAAMQCASLDERVVNVAHALVDLHREEGRVGDVLALLVPLERRFASERRSRPALAIVRILLAATPGATAYRLVLGDALVLMGAIDDAVCELGIAAVDLIDQGANDEAIAVLERILGLRADTKHARLAAERYLVRAAAGDGLRALAALKLCCDDDPKNIGILSLMATAFRLAGFASKAAEVERIIARISVVDAVDAGWGDAPVPHDGSEVEAALDRIDALVDASRLEEARTMVHDQLQRRPGNSLHAERAAELDAMASPPRLLPSPAPLAPTRRSSSDTIVSPPRSR